MNKLGVWETDVEILGFKPWGRFAVQGTLGILDGVRFCVHATSNRGIHRCGKGFNIAYAIKTPGFNLAYAGSNGD